MKREPVAGVLNLVLWAFVSEAILARARYSMCSCDPREKEGKGESIREKKVIISPRVAVFSSHTRERRIIIFSPRARAAFTYKIIRTDGRRMPRSRIHIYIKHTRASQVGHA